MEPLRMLGFCEETVGNKVRLVFGKARWRKAKKENGQQM